jgi:pimeloyl-ACP methyl ester carboxylesterase
MATDLSQLSTSERISRGLRIMFRTMRPRRDALVLPEEHRTAKGYKYHVYYPRGRPIRTVLLIYGMTLAGENDPRLLKLGRACTNAGLRVVVPHLPGLMQYRVRREDVNRLADIINTLTFNKNEKLGLLGFSTGGSYSLLIASRPRMQDKIGPIVLFSPIYDIAHISKHLHTAPDPAPRTPKEWDQFYWTQCVIAFRNMGRLGFSAKERAALYDLLTNYEDDSPKMKEAFYHKHIAPRQMLQRTDLYFEGHLMDSLSARGKLDKVTSPVFILHDARDRVVPPEQSIQMFNELTRRGAGFKQELLVTPWLSHVILQNTGNVTELVKIVQFTAELFKQST